MVVTTPPLTASPPDPPSPKRRDRPPAPEGALRCPPASRPAAAACALPALALALAALALPASASASGLDEAGYWQLADATQQRLDPIWDEHAGMYRPGGSGTDPAVNAGLLLTHAVAAQRGHEGPARNDHRARLIAARLTRRGGPFADNGQAAPGAQRHTPGWTNSMDSARASQHLVFDAEVVDGLVAAWRARRELDLPASTVAAIEDRIGRTVAGKFWRYPAIRLNQINWYGLMYAAVGDRQRPRHPAAPRPRAADPALRARHRRPRPRRRQPRAGRALPLPPAAVRDGPA